MRKNDEGSALVITIMVMAVVSVLASTVLAVTINNLGSVRRSQDASAALDAADAGVTQALAYLRSRGTRGLSCSPTCTANPWGNSANPTSLELPGVTDQSYDVWIEPRPTSSAPAFYRVHSLGRNEDGARAVQVDVELTLDATGLPLGVFARSVQGGGSASVQRESIYTTGCVYNRKQIAMSGNDLVTGIPAAVHSSKIVTESNGTNPNCSSSNKAIHEDGPCSTKYPYDHDVQGGPLTSTSCSGAVTAFPQYYGSRDLNSNGQIDVNGSYLRNDQALFDLFKIDDNPLNDAQMEQLKSIAQSQGTYRTTHVVGASPNPNTHPDSVFYFDLTDTDPGGIVNLNDIVGWGRAGNMSASHADCKQKSLIIVIEGGNARLNSNQQLAATLAMTSRAPYGEVIKANGTADFIGTIFSDKINLVGNIDLSLDECFLANLSPSLYTASVSNYIEVDR